MSDLTVIRANSYVVEKIVFDGDGGKSKMPQIAKLAVGGEDGEEDDDRSLGNGSSGSSVGGGETKEGEEDKALVPKVVLAVPQGKGKPIFFAALTDSVTMLMIKRAIGNYALIAMVLHI